MNVETGPQIFTQKRPPIAADRSGIARPGAAGRVAPGRVRGMLGAVLEAPAFVSSLDDVAVMGEAIEQRCRHLGIDEDAGHYGGMICNTLSRL